MLRIYPCNRIAYTFENFSLDKYKSLAHQFGVNLDYIILLDLHLKVNITTHLCIRKVVLHYAISRFYSPAQDHSCVPHEQ